MHGKGHKMIEVLVCLWGVISGVLGVWIFDKIPKSWLLDYGETSEDHPDLNFMAPRIANWAQGIGVVVLFSTAWYGLCYYHRYDKQYIIFGFIFLWLLMQLSIADMIYGILPDQMIIVFAVAALIQRGVTALGHNIRPSFLLDPLLGALVCGGGLICFGGLTTVIYRRETIGMGDCKLFGAIGILHGPGEGISVLIFAFLISGLYFTAMVLLGKLRFDSYGPFAPHIAISSSLYLIFN